MASIFAPKFFFHHCSCLSTSQRPDWYCCAEYVDGGEERWTELSKGRSSEELMEVLLAELAGVDLSEITRDKVFQGKVRGVFCREEK